MGHQHGLPLAAHRPQGHGVVGGAHFLHLAAGEGLVAVARLREVPVHAQQRGRVGALRLHADTGGKHRIVHLAAEGCRGYGTVLGPLDRRADVLVAAALAAPVTKLLALVNVGLARRGQQHGRGQFLLLQALAQVIGSAVLVVIGELDGVDEARALRLEEVPEEQHRLGEIVALGLADPVFQGPPEWEVETGRKSLIVRCHALGIVRPGLTDHIEIALAAVRLPGCVAVVVPGLQELHVVSRLVLVDPKLEGAGFRRLVGRAVVEVRHALVETGEIVAATRETDVLGGGIVDLVGGAELEGRAVAAPLGAAVPAGGGGADQEAPGRGEVHRDFEDAGAGLIQTHQHTVAVIEPDGGGSI